MLAKQAPSPPRCVVRESPLCDTERVERDAVGMQQARHVVIRSEQQRCRISERHIVEQHLRIDVTVRADQLELTDSLIDRARDRALVRFCRQQPIGVEFEFERVARRWGLVRSGARRRWFDHLPSPFGTE